LEGGDEVHLLNVEKSGDRTNSEDLRTPEKIAEEV